MNLYSIPAGAAFADALAQGILDRYGADPLALADVTVLLPTRRAVRVLTEAFLRQDGGAARLLPSIRPIGDVDEDELLLEPETGEGLDLPPPLPPLRRLLLLASLVQARTAQMTPRRTVGHAAAVRIAADLAALLDECAVQGVDPAALGRLDAPQFAEHWEVTAQMLAVIGHEWPQLLAAEGAADPAARRDRLVRAMAARWRAAPPRSPVIAAGSTGSIPATADLLAAVAALPQGAVVLPGLDKALDEESWEELAPDHPQFGLAQLLRRFGVTRAAVRDWPYAVPDEAAQARARLLSEALRPAATTDRWRAAIQSAGDELARGLEGLAVLEAATPQEEALAVALMMREALETQGRTAALVTPDRNLARRVAAELRRYGVAVDDSAGLPLAKTPPGLFLSALIEAAASGFAPVKLLALLKHPLAAAGLARAEAQRRLVRVELTALRGLRPAPGLDVLREALSGAPDLRAYADAVADAVAPLAALCGGRHGPGVWIAAHLEAAEALAAAEGESGAHRLWSGGAGEAAASFAAEFAEAASGGLPELAAPEYAEIFAHLAASRPVRPRGGRHPRLAIWGPLEARLQRADVMILGGLNEGVWPELPQVGPWINRAMRAAHGLEQPERRIGLSAHDFVQAASAPRVVLTRARKSGGEPATPARWLLRLRQLLKGMAAEKRLETPPHAAWAREIDTPSRIVPARPPAPRPPVAARPREFSATQIEKLVRDPYAIYARKVLGLEPLDDLEADPAAADRGNLVHRILERFTAVYPAALPRTAYERLHAIAAEELAQFARWPVASAFWRPRLTRLLDWIWEWETGRRAQARRVLSEISGRIQIAAPAGPILLKAKADRIECLDGGRIAILDYKTGAPPSKRQVEQGWSPQLVIEAIVARENGFADLGHADVAELAYVRLKGAGEEPGEYKPLDVDVPALSAETRARLAALFAHYDDPAQAYVSQRAPQSVRHVSDYALLARTAEWASAGGGE